MGFTVMQEILRAFVAASNGNRRKLSNLFDAELFRTADREAKLKNVQILVQSTADRKRRIRSRVRDTVAKESTTQGRGN